MTSEKKLMMLKAMMGIEGNEQDKVLENYLEAAGQEIMTFKYSLAEDDAPTDVDREDEMTQIHAVIAGYNMQGVESQTASIENGIHRSFKYADMIEYIRSNVFPMVKVIK